MNISMGLTIGQLIEKKFTLAIEMWPAYPDYLQLWKKQRKHKWKIPTEVLEEAGIIAASLTECQKDLVDHQNIELDKYLIANIVGSGKVYSDIRDLEEVSKDLQKRAFRGVGFPFTLQEDGLEYEVALTPMHKLVRNVPESQIHYPTFLEVASRQPILEKYLDRSVGITLAPCYFQPEGHVYCTYTPFLFTDFEVEDQKLKTKFRKVTSGELIGRILTDKRGGERLKGAVAEYLGIETEYEEWRDEVSGKTLFAELDELKQRYEKLDLKKYF